MITIVLLGFLSVWHVSCSLFLIQQHIACRIQASYADLTKLFMPNLIITRICVIFWLGSLNMKLFETAPEIFSAYRPVLVWETHVKIAVREGLFSRQFTSARC